MYKDIITYQLAEGITEAHLLKVAKQIINDWMSQLPGFKSWEICNEGEGMYTDIVHWESQEAAKNAEKEMMNIPNAGEWFACYKEGSISSKNLNVIAQF